jgi:hypothetical protein
MSTMNAAAPVPDFRWVFLVVGFFIFSPLTWERMA